MAKRKRKSSPFDMKMSGGMMGQPREMIRDTTDLMMGAATLELGFGALGMVSSLVKKP